MTSSLSIPQVSHSDHSYFLSFQQNLKLALSLALREI
jgi:hypothetical protein